MDPPDQLFYDKKFAKITLGIKIVWKFISELFEWVNYQYNFLLFIRIVSLRLFWIVWICVFHKIAGPLDTFLNKLCSSTKMNWLVVIRWCSVYQEVAYSKKPFYRLSKNSQIRLVRRPKKASQGHLGLATGRRVVSMAVVSNTYHLKTCLFKVSFRKHLDPFKLFSKTNSYIAVVAVV